MLERFGHSEVETARKAAALGCRFDGRALDEYLDIEVNVGVIAQTLGSAQVRLGSSHVLVGVKAEVECPEAHLPDEGRVVVGVEVSSSAAPGSEVRDLDDLGAALATQLQSLMFGRAAAGFGIDLRALSIIKGRSCWAVYVDCIVLGAGGSLLDALSLAAWAAIKSTEVPAVSVADNIEDATVADIEVDDDPHAGVKIDVARLPVVLGACQIGKRVMLGCTALEEAAASGRLLVSVNSQGQVCGVQKVGCTVMDISMIQHMISAAQKQGKAVLNALNTRASNP